MATVKEASVIRGTFGEAVQALIVEGFEFIGVTKEGQAFQQVEGEEIVVVKVIVKAEGFDVAEAVAEQTAIVAKRVQKEKEHAEKVAKATKARKEKEAKEATAGEGA